MPAEKAVKTTKAKKPPAKSKTTAKNTKKVDEAPGGSGDIEPKNSKNNGAVNEVEEPVVRATRKKNTAATKAEESKKEEVEEPAKNKPTTTRTTRKAAPRAAKERTPVPEKEGTPEAVEKAKPAAKARKAKVVKEPEAAPAKKEAPKRIRGTKAKANQVAEEPVPKKKVTKNGETSKKGPASNPTETQWDSIVYTCSKKNSQDNEANTHIVSWNVGGVRGWLKKGGLEILEKCNLDIFCVQETRCSEDNLPDEVKTVEGYKTFWAYSDKKGYAGVGLLSKIDPIKVEIGIGDEEYDTDGRCITAEYEKFILVNVYVPNAGRRLVTLPKRLGWNEVFKAYIKKLEEKKPVIICGDMNVAHSEIDLTNPKTNTKNAGFTPEEREGMTVFLKDGFVDVFRHFYPDKENSYTFWSYMGQARSKNIGWRLDYFIVSKSIVDNICDNVIQDKILGSDHCPISLFLNI